MKYLLLAVLMLFPAISMAHEMTPTYPQLRPAFLQGLYVTEMRMFNKRADVEFYEIGVFDDEFNPVPFVTSYNVIQIKYLSTVTFDVYIRAEDVNKARYICSRSKIRKKDEIRTAISSRICSKIK